MSPDRTASTTLRPSFAQRSAAPDTATPDGFAALLGAVDTAPAPARPERRDTGAPADRRERHDDRAATPATDPAVPAPPAAEAPTPAAPPAAVAAADAPVVADPLLPFAPPAPAPVVADAPVVTVPAPPTVPVADPAAQATPVAAPVVATDPAPAPPVAAPVDATAPVAETAAPVAPEAPAVALPQDALPTAADLPLADIPADALPAEPAAAPDAPEAPAPTPAQTAPAAAGDAGTPSGGTGEQPAPREQAAAPAEAPAPAPTAPSAPPAQAASAPAPVTNLSFAQRATPLHQAPRAVAQVIQVAQERDISHAKLNLRPVELGGIEIRLQSSAAGVTAQVIADSPEAAKLLQQAADDLRRSLERQDVNLLSLDVSTAGDGRPDGSAGTSADLADDRARHFAAFGGAPEGADAADDVPAVIETVEIADGVHIDVLA